MVWSKIDPRDGKPRYLRRNGGILQLTRFKTGRLLDEVPEGWAVDPGEDKRLRLHRK